MIKKNLLTFLLFLLIGFVILVLLNYAYTNTNAFRLLYACYKYECIPDKIRIANLGSSHGMYAFKYEREDAFNFALPGQNLYYDQILLEEYIDRFEEESILFVTISYMTFGDYDDYRLKNMSPRYYRIVEPKKIYDYKYIDELRYKILPILSAEYRVLHIIKDKKLPNNYQDMINHEQQFLKEEMVEVAEKRWQSPHFKTTWKKEMYDGNKERLESIIRLCKEKGIKPILITTPVTKEFNELYSDESYKDFSNRVTEISKKNNVTYLDFSHDERFVNDISLFVDADHLSKLGRDMFMDILRSKLSIKE